MIRLTSHVYYAMRGAHSEVKNPRGNASVPEPPIPTGLPPPLRSACIRTAACSLTANQPHAPMSLHQTLTTVRHLITDPLLRQFLTN